MLTQEVPISAIRVPATRITAVYDQELQEMLKSTMETMGMIQPIVVVKNEDYYYLVDGLHRLQEMQASGETVINAVIYEGEEKDVMLTNLVLNRTRGKTKASEMVKVISLLFSYYEMDPDQIRDKTGLTREYIEKLIKISLASPSVQELLDQEVIGVGAAFEISRLPAWVQQDEMCAKAQIWRYSVKELKGLIDEVLQIMSTAEGTKPALAPHVRPTYACQGCQKELDPRDLRPVMLCPNCYGEVWRASRKESIQNNEQVGDFC